MDTKINLCDNCKNSIATCKSKEVEYGDNKGKDNVIECDAYANKHNNGGVVCKNCHYLCTVQQVLCCAKGLHPRHIRPDGCTKFFPNTIGNDNKGVNFKKHDIIIHQGEYFSCIVCDDQYACFGKTVHNKEDRCLSTSFKVLFIVSNTVNLLDGFEFERTTGEDIRNIHINLQDDGKKTGFDLPDDKEDELMFFSKGLQTARKVPLENNKDKKKAGN